MSITMTIPDLAPTEQLLQVRKYIIQDVKKARQEAVKEGMLPDKGPYELYLRNRGRLTKRKESTLDPRFLKIGTATRPLEFEYITAGNWDVVVKAAQDAHDMLRRRMPVDSGNYLGLLNTYLNNRISRQSALSRVNDTTTAIVSLASSAEYSGALESGFYGGRYETHHYQREGIFLYVTRMLRKKYGNAISLRFTYVNIGKMNVPAIDIAMAGVFAGNDATPGSRTRKGRRSRGRRK